MEITLRRSLGSTRAGTTINVDARLGKALVTAGHATPVESTARPTRARARVADAPRIAVAPAASAPRVAAAPAEPPRVATAPRTPASDTDLSMMLKSQLVEIAQGLGITLDGSETKADLITRIENMGGRYARRDMRADK